MRSSFALAALLALSASAAEIVVKVGGPGVLKFDPETVEANVGDVIRFEFHQKNHTVTQSSLASPCLFMDGGFDSGFVPVADNITEFPEATLTVEATTPIWAYCRQGNHCQQGMVFAVNPGDKFEQFKNAATGNGSESAPAASSTSAAPSVVTVTATVTASGDTRTTTYTTAPSATASSTPMSVDHKVVVGGPDGQLSFDPPSLSANEGDTVTFEFHTKNHTVTQSSFNDPCRMLSETSTTGATGFDSGFKPVTGSTFPTFVVQVNDTKPIWGYCRQANHCGQGMAFAINAPSTGNTFSAFLANAKRLNGTGSAGDAADGAVQVNFPFISVAVSITFAAMLGMVL
ncbi:Cupredoxin [Cylindrobasidium torrendii FP15055 ss-10]|uniref:Cupredoxin n=1 Tax=Cylindrobasidium torrendii FP15055 ss-10 TaxID=1314674 RepID=A0A0D7BIU0_9AGAR|nr:Cupredoxin [Cylindrobasidium torrendii FP15055 ss-10]